MNTAQVDFQQLRIKHILYKSKARSAVYGGSYDDTFFSRLGPVNSWLDTIGLVKYRSEPEMAELIRIQNELNAEIGRLTTLYKSGKIDEAHEGLSKIEAMSERFLSLVSQMERRLGN